MSPYCQAKNPFNNEAGIWNTFMVYMLAACSRWYENSLDICKEADIGGIIGLMSRPVNITAPADPDRGCNYYKMMVNCSVTIEVGLGQKILVTTGGHYRLQHVGCPGKPVTNRFQTKPLVYETQLTIKYVLLKKLLMLKENLTIFQI